MLVNIFRSVVILSGIFTRKSEVILLSAKYVPNDALIKQTLFVIYQLFHFRPIGITSLPIALHLGLPTSLFASTMELDFGHKKASPNGVIRTFVNSNFKRHSIINPRKRCNCSFIG